MKRSVTMIAGRPCLRELGITMHQFISVQLLLCSLCGILHAADLSATAYPTIQAALDANPDRMIFVPAGDYPITQKIRISGERSGLFGPGRIIQQSADQPIIEIEHAGGPEVRDLTLTRPEGKMETATEEMSFMG